VAVGDDVDERPWYRRPAVWVVIAVVVLAGGIAVGLVLADGDDEPEPTTSTTTSSTTTSTTSTTSTTTTSTTTTVVTTTAPSDEVACAAGDQLACDRLTDDQLRAMCDAGNEDACQVLLARQGDDDGPVEGD
jgi:hypothetical protein